jgi:hypothetical protein
MVDSGAEPPWLLLSNLSSGRTRTNAGRAPREPAARRDSTLASISRCLRHGESFRAAKSESTSTLSNLTGGVWCSPSEQLPRFISNAVLHATFFSSATSFATTLQVPRIVDVQSAVHKLL